MSTNRVLNPLACEIQFSDGVLLFTSDSRVGCRMMIQKLAPVVLTMSKKLLTERRSGIRLSRSDYIERNSKNIV
jgi:hypothetical protein